MDLQFRLDGSDGFLDRSGVLAVFNTSQVKSANSQSTTV